MVFEINIFIISVVFTKAVSRRCSVKKLAKCTAKHLCQILSFNKVCNSDLTSTQGTSIPINFNTPISSFNPSIVEFEDNIDLQTEKAFSNNNT